MCFGPFVPWNMGTALHFGRDLAIIAQLPLGTIWNPETAWSAGNCGLKEFANAFSPHPTDAISSHNTIIQIEIQIQIKIRPADNCGKKILLTDWLRISMNKNFCILGFPVLCKISNIWRIPNIDVLSIKTIPTPNFCSRGSLLCRWEFEYWEK